MDKFEGDTRTAAYGSDTQTRTHTASHLLVCNYTWGFQKCLLCRPELCQRVYSPEEEEEEKTTELSKATLLKTTFQLKPTQSEQHTLINLYGGGFRLFS